MSVAEVSGFHNTNGWSSGRRYGFVAVVAGALTIALVAPLCFFAVENSQYALVTEFGKPLRVVKEPGLGFKYPYQSVQKFDNRLFVFTAASNEFLTLEKTSVVAAGTVLWRIADPKKFFETVFDRAGGESRLGDTLFAELGAAIGRNAFQAFAAVDPKAFRADAILAEVTAKCRDIALKDYGIAVVDVWLQRFDFPAQNRGRVYARMASERGRISMKYRSEGEEEGLKVRAVADQEKSGILTEALKLAQQHRAEGEGEAARIYGAALSKGPDFYQFLRTMEASKNLVPKGTTMVLPADSELFRLLYDSDYYDRREAPRKRFAEPGKEAAMR